MRRARKGPPFFILDNRFIYVILSQVPSDTNLTEGKSITWKTQEEKMTQADHVDNILNNGSRKPPRNHTGWHVFWGVIGAFIALVVVAGLSYGGFITYNRYAPPAVQAQVESDLAKLQSDVASLKNPPPVKAVVDASSTTDITTPDDTLKRVVKKTVVSHPIDELTAAVAATNDSVKSVSVQVKGLVGNVQELTGSVTKVNGRVDEVVTKMDGIGTRVATLEKQQATPAPQPAPAPAPAPQAQQDSAPKGQQVAPEVPEKMSQAETEFFVPPGFHLNAGMGKEKNLSRMHACVAPHRLEIDRDSSKCHAAGYNDPHTGLPVRRCPNKCV